MQKGRGVIPGDRYESELFMPIIIPTFTRSTNSAFEDRRPKAEEYVKSDTMIFCDYFILCLFMLMALLVLYVLIIAP